MPTYTIFPLEPPVSPSQLAAYKTLRLASLRIDPHAFVSTYVREVGFSEDVWRQRLDSPFKRTLIASALDAASHECDRDVNEETGECIGTASIIGPSEMPPYILAPFKEAGVCANWETYGLYAMWVHPAHRGKGVGAQLVEACLEWARTNVDIKFSSENNGACEKVVLVLVYDNNVAGRALYSRMGFTDVEGVPAGEGERWMLCKV
ncbi:acyl-CoA N-acyltransferase [Lanmaoa asiatica]|nr:acyl-CoA N-acyltransferase [Lanmaoa asiatica]